MVSSKIHDADDAINNAECETNKLRRLAPQASVHASRALLHYLFELAGKLCRITFGVFVIDWYRKGRARTRADHVEHTTRPSFKYREIPELKTRRDLDLRSSDEFRNFIELLLASNAVDLLNASKNFLVHSRGINPRHPRHDGQVLSEAVRVLAKQIFSDATVRVSSRRYKRRRGESQVTITIRRGDAFQRALLPSYTSSLKKSEL